MDNNSFTPQIKPQNQNNFQQDFISTIHENTQKTITKNQTPKENIPAKFIIISAVEATIIISLIIAIVINANTTRIQIDNTMNRTNESYVTIPNTSCTDGEKIYSIQSDGDYLITPVNDDYTILESGSYSISDSNDKILTLYPEENAEERDIKLDENRLTDSNKIYECN